MGYVARVDITLKPAVNDPQGNTILGALHSLGFEEVDSVRAGKYMEIRLEAADKANPVIEDFRFEIEEAK